MLLLINNSVGISHCIITNLAATLGRLRAEYAFCSISFIILINYSWCLFIWSVTETMRASKLANLSSISLLSASRESLGDGGGLLDFPCFVEGITKNALEI